MVQEAAAVKATRHHQHLAISPRCRFADLFRHEFLALNIDGIDGFLPPSCLEAQAVDPLQKNGRLRRGRLHQSVPQRVEIIDAQLLAEREDVSAAGQCRIRIAVSFGASKVGPGQVDEARFQIPVVRHSHRDPFGRILAEGIEGTPSGLGLAEIAVDRDREIMVEPQFVEVWIEVGWALHQHGGGFDILDQALHEMSAGGTVMADRQIDHWRLQVAEPPQDVFHDVLARNRPCFHHPAEAAPSFAFAHVNSSRAA